MPAAAILQPCLLSLCGLVASLVAAAPPPHSNQPALLLAAPGQAGALFARLVAIDPDIRLLGFTLGQTGLRIVYAREDLPRQLAGSGALLLLGGGGPGCRS